MNRRGGKEGKVVVGTPAHPNLFLSLRLSPGEVESIERTLDRLVAILEKQAGPGIRVTRTDAARALYCGNIAVIRIFLAELEAAAAAPRPREAHSALAVLEERLEREVVAIARELAPDLVRGVP